MKDSPIKLHLRCPMCGSRRVKIQYNAMIFEDGEMLKYVVADAYDDEAIQALQTEGHRFLCWNYRVCRNCDYSGSHSEFDPETVLLKNDYQCDCGEKIHHLMDHDWATETLLVECQKCNKVRYVKLPFQV